MMETNGTNGLDDTGKKWKVIVFLLAVALFALSAAVVSLIVMIMSDYYCDWASAFGPRITEAIYIDSPEDEESVTTVVD